MIHIWKISLQSVSPYDTWLPYLADDERQRADRFIHQVDHDRFVIARGVLRVLLGHYCQTSPGDIVFEYGEHGKPDLKSGQLHFNLSHAGDWMACIFAKNQAVGIDIECIRELDIDGIASRFFSPGENQVLQEVLPVERLAVFFQIWSRKEAFIKAIGSGLFYELQQFDVYQLPGWTIQDFKPADGYTGAWATQAEVSDVKYYSDFADLDTVGCF